LTNIYSDTIAAISTGMTGAGIGIIRMSGQDAVKIADGIFSKKRKKPEFGVVKSFKSHTINHGYIFGEDGILDEVLLMLMLSPATYTGEDVVEINCHGGLSLQKKILELVIRRGARLAEPGEFTKRAFLNGKLDLTQAEAVADVINSESGLALKASMSQLGGDMGNELDLIRNELTSHVAYIEAALDDPEHIQLDDFMEELPFKLEKSIERLKKLIKEADSGRLIREGVRTVIVGPPNAGKSSILNRLLGQERAIVTNIPGTTRDILEDRVLIGDLVLNIADTAGIRTTEDEVEKIGVERALNEADEADLLLYVADSSEKLSDGDREIAKKLRGRTFIVLLNKSDLEPVTGKDDIAELVGEGSIIEVSAATGEGFDDFEKALNEAFLKGFIRENDHKFILNIRHKEAAIQAAEAIERAMEGVKAGMPEDFITIDLMDACSALGSITGENVSEDVIDRIFSDFCMGK